MIHSLLSTSLRSTFFPDPSALSSCLLLRSLRSQFTSLSLLAFVRWQRAGHNIPLPPMGPNSARSPGVGGEKENFHERFASSSLPPQRERGGPEIAGGTTTETSLALCSPAAKTNLTEKRERRYYVQAVSHLTDSVKTTSEDC